MVKPWNFIAAANAAEPAASPDAGSALPSDPTTLDLDQLMDLRLRAGPPQNPEDALKDRQPAVAGDDVPRPDDLPADLTTMSLGDLMNLRVRASQQDDEKDDKDKKKGEEDQTNPQGNGEDTGDAQQIAADDSSGAAAAQGGEGEATQADGEGTGDGGGDGAEGAPPHSGGSDGGESNIADLGQTIEILPADLVYVAALRSADSLPSAPAPPPVAARPVVQQVQASAPPPPPSTNGTPVARDDQAATNEDAAVIIRVLGNDADADGDAVRVTAVTQGQNGHVAINADGTLTYTPVADFFGGDSFIYTISDGRGGTSSATVSLVVRPVNDAPAAADDTTHTAQGQPVTVAVLANDGDAEGDALTVTAASQGTNGQVAINADGTLTYFPAAGFAGTDSFTYTVSDGQGGSAQATVNVVVSPVNAPPTAGDGLAAMEAGTPISGTLTAADPDNALADLHFSLAAAPAHGAAVVRADGTYTYTPAPGFVGTDAFTFSVADPSGATASATVTIDVLPRTFDTASGHEFAVNTTTAAAQQAPAMAALQGGGFVTTWESQNQDGSGFGIFAQRFDANGQPAGPEFQVNTFTQNHQQLPEVAALANGGFVIVWTSQNQDGNNNGVFAQRFDANGQAAGAEFQVNTFIQGAQDAADVAALADGGFVVTWQSQSQDGNGMGVFAQRFDAAGQAVGGEFQVNTFTQNGQQAPDVAALADGGFVVVWESQNQDGNNLGVFGQRFDATGEAVGSEFRINTFTQNAQQSAEVAALADGGYVVVWESQNQDGSNLGLFGQRFAADGSAAGGEFRINTQTLGNQQTAAVAALADGGFAVVWQSDGQDGSGFGVFGQRFDANGAAIGPEFQINGFTAGAQGMADVAVLADGSLAVTWQSAGQDGSFEGVFARVFVGTASTAHTFAGGSGNDSFIGGALADSLSGAGGDDRLDGGLGADQLFGGSGDDILLWDAADAVIDGGTGHDTLLVTGGNVDLASFAGNIGGIESIDLASDAGANTLALRAQDILDISDTDVLSVLGNSSDSVNAGTGWTQAGSDGQDHDIYTHVVGGAVVTLIVDSDITLNADLLL
ncbi:MAG TPA: tandem-95 repeat protein [Kiloniellales bacterium]